MRGGPEALAADRPERAARACVPRSRNGAGRRWPTWRSSRSQRPRSRGWRTCGPPPARIVSRPTSSSAAAPSLVELEQLVAAEPLRERLRGQLMLALYRAGRQGEALDAYRDAVRTLDAELGPNPDRSSSAAQQAILTHDPALLQARAAETPPQAEQRRATATILCAELADFAAVRAVLGDADADRVRVALAGRARDALAAHGATAVTVMGDGFVAAFSAAGAGLACAVELQRAVARQARLEQIPLELRVGVGAGDVAWAGDDYSGTPVVEAQALWRRAGGRHPRRRDRASARRVGHRRAPRTPATLRSAAWFSRSGRGRSAGRRSTRSPCRSRHPSRSTGAPSSSVASRSWRACERHGTTPFAAAAAACS